MEMPKTLQQALIYFDNPDNCQRFMIDVLWPDGKVTCPRCGSEKVTYLANQRRWKCYSKHSKAQFSVKVGTIFEDSPISLDKWLAALWLIVNCKNGISSMELHRDLGVTQKTAWFMAHRLRCALNDGGFGKLGGEVEVDETFIGGKARNMHIATRKRRITGTGGKDKTIVFGMVERGGKVKAKVVSSRKREALQPEIRKHVEAGSALYSDALLSYRGLASDYAHQVIDHAVSYVEGNIHTNSMENYWALLKRGIAGTYISVEPFHLFRYLDEQSFRYNNRKQMNDFDRFVLALAGITNKRLTYSELTGKNRTDLDHPTPPTAH
jgi:transposase-like protein